MGKVVLAEMSDDQRNFLEKICNLVYNDEELVEFINESSNEMTQALERLSLIFKTTSLAGGAVFEHENLLK